MRASTPIHGGQPHQHRHSRGQALIEFALTALLFLTLLFGVIEVGRLLHSWVTLQHAAEEAGRYATPGTGHDTGDREDQVRDTARLGATGLVIDYAAGPNQPGHFAVSMRSSGSSADPSEADDAGGPNEFVRISLLYNHPVLTWVFGRAYIPLRAEALVLNERYARPSGPAGAPPGGGLPEGQLPSTPVATWTPSPTPSPTGSPTATMTPSITPTPSATPEGPCYTLSTSVNPSNGGSISVSPGPNCAGGRYVSGTQVQLTANPGCMRYRPSGSCREYYEFDRWSGDVPWSQRWQLTVSITMDENKAVTARFD